MCTPVSFHQNHVASPNNFVFQQINTQKKVHRVATGMPYLLKQPETLQNETVNVISAWIARQAPKLATPIAALRREADPAAAERALRRQILILQNHFYHNLPKKFHDVILANTMTQLLNLLGQQNKFTNEERKVIWRLTDAFYTDHVTSLSLPCTDHIQDILQNSLCAKSIMLTSLSRLEISCMHSYPSEFECIQLLRPLHSLKHLTITNVCTDNILRCIVTYCSLIEKLNISSSIKVNNSSTRILIDLPYLESIDLRNTSVGSEGIETILLSCKKIVVIESDVNLKNILKGIAESEEKFPKLFKLSTYTSVKDTLEELELVIQMCPLIQSLGIQQPCQYTGRPMRPSCFVMAIAGLRHLRQFKLTGFNFYQNKINEVLQIIGGNLVQLYLERVEELNMISLVTLSQTCPNLESLSIIDCRFANQTMSFYYEPKDPPFRNIKTIFFNIGSQLRIPLTCLFDRYASHSLPRSDVSFIQEPAFFLLSSCLNVESIEIRNTYWLTEYFMLRLLDKNPLACLKVLRIEETLSHAMTRLVMDKMVESCSSRPQIILV